MGLQGFNVGGTEYSIYVECSMTAEGEHLDKIVKRSTLERGTIEGNSPVFKNNFMLLVRFLKYCRE